MARGRDEDGRGAGAGGVAGPEARTRDLVELYHSLSSCGDWPALIAFRGDEVERWTYAELAARAGRLARKLRADGVAAGDRVLLFAEPSPEWVVVCLAAVAARAVVVPIDAQLAGEELVHVLTDADPALLFCDRRRRDRLASLDDAPELPVVLLDGEAPEGKGSDDVPEERRLEALVADEPLEEDATPAPDEIAVLFYTSGTTGPPKGVPLTHANLATQLEALEEIELLSDSDRVLVPIPLHHVYPFVLGLLGPLWLGAAIVLPRSLTGQQLLRAIREGRVTKLVGVPRLYSGLVRALEAGGGNRVARGALRGGQAVLGGLRRWLGLRAGRVLLAPLHRRLAPELQLLASGGAPLDPQLAWRLEGLGWRVVTGYGLTETSPLISVNVPGATRFGSAGRPLTGVEVRIAPLENEASADGEGSNEQGAQPPRRSEAEHTGEIQVRGPNVFAGYRDLPDKTEEAFTEDGWFRTGDLGRLDDDGYLHVEGRVSTRLVSPGGENIQPEEVEDAYAEHPLVRESGVLQRDEGLAALVVADPREVRRRLEEQGEEATPERVEELVREAVRERSDDLPSYQRVAEARVTREPLPRTRLGKIRRHLLEERFEAAEHEGADEGEQRGPQPIEDMSSDDQRLLEAPPAAAAWSWLAERYSDRPLTPESSPELDLGIDSLAWVDLTVELAQETGVELDEEAIERIETVRDLLEEVAEAGGQAGGALAPVEDPETVLDDSELRWLERPGLARRALLRAAYPFAWSVFWAGTRLEVVGREHVPQHGPCVLAPNHQSYLDPLAIALALGPRRLQDTYWGGWTAVLFANPLSRLLSRLVNVLPVDPRRGATSSLAIAAAALLRGKTLVWFPEGTRSATGELQPLKQGLGSVLEQHRAAVIPVWIEGTHEVLGRGQALPRPHKVRVTFGRPLEPDALERQGKGEAARERIVSGLRQELARLGAGDERG